MSNRTIALYEAAEMALKKLGGSGNLGEILGAIKENNWFVFKCASGQERGILVKSMSKSQRIIKDELESYKLIKSVEELEMREKKLKVEGFLKTIFISHYSGDQAYVKQIINALEKIGIKSDQIRCSSFEGYGVEADEDIFEWIRKGLTDDVYVLFVMSESYFTRPVCMCEMGAVWVQSKKYTPILIPPLDFSTMQQGMIPVSKKAYMINNTNGLTEIKESIEKNFGLEPIRTSIWNGFLEDYSTIIDFLLLNDEKNRIVRESEKV